MQFIGIPSFAPELFRQITLKDPLKQKALLKGLVQLGEEGTIQYFRPLIGNQMIVGAIGMLQFDVLQARLSHEYKVPCQYTSIDLATVRWVECDDAKALKEFKTACEYELAYDSNDHLVYLAPTFSHV